MTIIELLLIILLSLIIGIITLALGLVGAVMFLGLDYVLKLFGVNK